MPAGAAARSAAPAMAARTGAVPDLVEELAVATLGDGGQVETLLDPPGGTAARLRYPLQLTGYMSLALDGAARPVCRTCYAANLPVPMRLRGRCGKRPRLARPMASSRPRWDQNSQVPAAAPAVGVVDLHGGIGCCRG